MKIHLQPLRIEAGWQITYNQLYEIDPIEGNENFFEGSSLLVLQNNARLTLIDVDWKPEFDIKGTYRIKVLNFVENFNEKTNNFILEPNWQKPYLTFTTQSRIELVEKLESLMLTLPVYTDPRFTKKRGVVDVEAETFRLEIIKNGLSKSIFQDVLTQGSESIQTFVINHPKITKEMLISMVQNGKNKKIKNIANQKLMSQLKK